MSHLHERDAAGVVMLAVDDPERVEALAHAARCPRCHAQLAAAERTLALLTVLDGHTEPLPAHQLALLERSLARAIDASSAAARRARMFRVGLVALTLWGALLVALAPLVWGASGVHGGFALKCSLVELGAASLPFGALAYLRRRSSLGALDGALAAGVGALCAELWLVATCPDRDLTHQLVFHAGAVALAMGLGAAGALRPSAARPR